VIVTVAPKNVLTKMFTDGLNDKNRIGDDFCEDAFERDTLQNQNK
jgi:hypothetical protein